MTKIQVLSPTSNESFRELVGLSPEQVKQAFISAGKAQPQWEQTPANARALIAKKLHAMMLARQEDILRVLQLETGKARVHAFEELTGALAAIRYYAQISPRALRSVRAKPSVPLLVSTEVQYVPVGVVGIVTPWNYPLALTMMDVIPALLAGNAVVQKPDNQTLGVTELVHDLALGAGVPANIWQLVYGDAELVGNTLVDTADYVAFTGSTATGRKVASRASSRLIGYSLELGGKNPMIVLPGAELGKAAELAIAGAFGNSGQLCVSIERLYVANPDKERLLVELANRVNTLKLGTAEGFDHDLGPLYSARHFDRVQKMVEVGLKQGGRLIAGGTALPELGANYYAPTVIADLPLESDLTREEVFGPIIVVTGYDEVADAVRLANDSEYGLNASVIGPISLAKQVAKQLRFGSVNINEGYRASMSSMDAPMGGMKNSGVGRRSGKSGLLRFTEPRTVSVAKSWPIGLPTRASQYVKMAPLMNALAKFQGR